MYNLVQDAGAIPIGRKADGYLAVVNFASGSWLFPATRNLTNSQYAQNVHTIILVSLVQEKQSFSGKFKESCSSAQDMIFTSSIISLSLMIFSADVAIASS